MQTPPATHTDRGGIKEALAGDWGEGDIGIGAGGQQHPTAAAQDQHNGGGQHQQAGQAGQAAGGAQGENHPHPQEGREAAAQ